MKYKEDALFKYIKTDKNGTEIYHDYRCDRCNGKGSIDRFNHVDNGVCFKCLGSGIKQKPTVIKAYTEEYRATLDEKAKQKQIKNLIKNVEKINQSIERKLGFIDTYVLYVYMGKTYQHRETLKNFGGVFHNLYGTTPVWICKRDPGYLKDTYRIAISKDDIPKVEGELGVGQYQDIYSIGNIKAIIDFIEEVKSKEKQ